MPKYKVIWETVIEAKDREELDEIILGCYAGSNSGSEFLANDYRAVELQ